MPSPTRPRERILAAFPDLPAKQRRLARFILDNEDMVAFATASDISQQAGASAATVVRFCRTLGYKGYTDLQTAIRAQIPHYQTAVQKLTERMTNGGFNDSLPPKIAATNIENIRQTMSRVSEATLAAAVADIIQARRILIFGSGLSAAAAVFAEHSLNLLGFSARAFINRGLVQLMDIARLTGQDLVIIISVWRYLRNTVEAAQAAKATGAKMIALVDSPVAPAASLADHVFVADIEGALHSRSLAGIISLVDLLSASIVAERPQESMAALRKVDRLYRENGMLLGD